VKYISNRSIFEGALGVELAMVDSALLSRDGHGSANSLRPPDEAVVSVIRTAEEMKEALAIRHQVFVVGQGVPIEEEIDAYDGNGDPQKVRS
jgi:hypothetical protein